MCTTLFLSIVLACIWDTGFQSEAFRACAFVWYTSSSLLHTRLSFEEACLYTLASLACMLSNGINMYYHRLIRNAFAGWKTIIVHPSNFSFGRFKGKNAW